MTETSCLMPSQGSGPYMGGLGTGYYTVDDYKEILRYADQRHIQVVPEIDMPSHMRAALMSIKKFQHDRPGRRGEIYKMTDKEDGNNYRSAQGYNDNSANPCREGLYNFIEVVLTTIVDLHKNIQPLTLFHFGGDEVPTRALQDMKCSVVEPDINKYFIERILNNKRFYNISFAAWEDGMLQEDKNPYKLSELSPNSKRYSKFKLKMHLSECTFTCCTFVLRDYTLHYITSKLYKQLNLSENRYVQCTCI